jgi:hypothetical protein
LEDCMIQQAINIKRLPKFMICTKMNGKHQLN